MRRLIFVTALALAAPLAAQTSLKPPASTDGTRPREKLVIVYGNEACPKSSNADEIIVCSRRPEEERYRIPAGVRSGQAAPGSKPRSALVGADTGAGGAGGSIGSCTPIGPGGGTGCSQAAQDAYRAEKNPR